MNKQYLFRGNIETLSGNIYICQPAETTWNLMFFSWLFKKRQICTVALESLQGAFPGTYKGLCDYGQNAQLHSAGQCQTIQETIRVLGHISVTGRVQDTMSTNSYLHGQNYWIKGKLGWMRHWLLLKSVELTSWLYKDRFFFFHNTL